MLSDIKTHPLAPWLSLLHSPGIGPRRYAVLLEKLGSPANIIQCNKSQLQQTGLSEKIIAAILSPRWDLVARDLEWLNANEQHHILTLHDDAYPTYLKEISDPPPLLFVIGSLHHLNKPQLAIIGSRNPSPGGLETAFQFAKDIANHQLNITSGLALGIDAAAHQGALASQQGNTIAVMGTGPDQVYPKRHQKLAASIIQQGALITEFSPGTQAKAENFPRRNRIISGLSSGVLVVEANIKSGSLITARLAMEQDRDVFAVPGSIHSPTSRGCHQLIKQGAKLVETTQDIWEEISLNFLSPSSSPATTQPDLFHPTEHDPDTRLLMANLDYDPVTMDTLIARSRLTSEQLSAILLGLELRGLVTTLPGGYYCKRT